MKQVDVEFTYKQKQKWRHDDMRFRQRRLPLLCYRSYETRLNVLWYVYADVSEEHTAGDRENSLFLPPEGTYFPTKLLGVTFYKGVVSILHKTIEII